MAGDHKMIIFIIFLGAKDLFTYRHALFFVKQRSSSINTDEREGSPIYIKTAGIKRTS